MFGHQCKRAVKDSLEDLTRCARAAAAEFPVLLAESRTALRSDDRVAETNYQEGKVQNLQRAAAEINGAFLQAGKTFSFWKEVGRTSKRRGYAVGRTLQEGCLIPAVGGGLCQLSNAIYDAALQSGCEIVERHAHSQVVPGSTAAEGRDATVTWNYVDLRFRAPHPLLIRAELEGGELVVGFFGREGPKRALDQRAQVKPAALAKDAAALAILRTCRTCEETGCFRYDRTNPKPRQ
jgi:vancomycin resistance protein YoaR